MATTNNNTITLDVTKLDRSQTFALQEITAADEDTYDANNEAICSHIAAHAFRWAWEARRAGDWTQASAIIDAFLPDDYDAPGVMYDALGIRFDSNDWSMTYPSGDTEFAYAEWLDMTSTDHWDMVEEAARIYSKDGETEEVTDIAAALGYLTRKLAPKATARPDKRWWLSYIREFAEYNYENGERVEG